MQNKKRVVLGVTGSIAVYKACDIIRELKRKQLDVRVIMTCEAQKFISQATFAALSQNPVGIDLFSSQPYGPIPHCDLAKETDLFLVAPATAHIIAKFAHGFADDLPSALFLAVKSPVVIAPAMNPNMYSHPIVQKNIKSLSKEGIFFIDPVQAEVACGQKGQGHLAPIESICTKVEELLYKKGSFRGLSFLITAGPTREFIDPVRFISNRSSGKMGFALAKAARDRGGEVTLISGPTDLSPPEGINFVPVVTSDDMLAEAEKVFKKTDVVIMAAAVTDFKPAEKCGTKIKKEYAIGGIRVEGTIDILSRLGEKKKSGQIIVGFAAEDRNIIQNAEKKLKAKNLDLIVANDISLPGSGFETDTIQVILINKSGEKKFIPKGEKSIIAENILDELGSMLD